MDAPGGVRFSDPDTSHSAASSIDAARLEWMVLEQMAAPVAEGVVGWTCWELSQALGMTHQTVSPRFAPLVKKGAIVDSGDRRPGLAPQGFKKDGAPRSGRMQIVWVLTGKRPRTLGRTKMEVKELDDALFAALQEALSNSGIPITARAKVRIADELCAEGMRLITAQLKREQAASGATTPKKLRKPRGPNKPKGSGTQPDLPGVPAMPHDATTPAPFGAR